MSNDSLTVCVCVQVDLMFIQALYGIRDVHKSGIGEEDFSEVCVYVCQRPQLPLHCWRKTVSLKTVSFPLYTVHTHTYTFDFMANSYSNIFSFPLHL